MNDFNLNFIQAMENVLKGKAVKCDYYPDRIICKTSAGIGYKNQIGSILLQHKFLNAKWKIADDKVKK